jgi:hypothetical protein
MEVLFNPLVAFYDIHKEKREALFFYFVTDTTRSVHSEYLFKNISQPNIWHLINKFNTYCLPMLYEVTDKTNKLHFGSLVLCDQDRSLKSDLKRWSLKKGITQTST